MLYFYRDLLLQDSGKLRVLCEDQRGRPLFSG